MEFERTEINRNRVEQLAILGLLVAIGGVYVTNYKDLITLYYNSISSLMIYGVSVFFISILSLTSWLMSFGFILYTFFYEQLNYGIKEFDCKIKKS